MIFINKKHVILGLVILLALIFCGSATAATINVSPGTDTIKTALASAQNGDTLNLSAGTYNDYNLVVNKNLVIQGPEVSGDPTAIIDGQDKGRVFQIMAGTKVTLKNLQIINGQAPSGTYGGAVHTKGETTIQKCKFTGNKALWGGAIYNDFGGVLGITDCIFTNNEATTYGGAIKNEGTYCTITGSTFSGNKGTEGGALNDLNYWEIINCIFTGNIGTRGGAIANYGTTIFTDCTFTGNTASEYGGVLCNYGSTTFNRCTMTSNTATVYGGVVYNWGGSVSVNKCTVSNNNAKWGEFIYSGGSNGVTANFNRILNYGNQVIYSESGTLDATKNWWGNNNPSLSSIIGGSVTYNPWIVLKISSSSSTVAPGETATITADLNHDNNGNLLSGGYLPDNLGVTFAGTVSPLSDTTKNGVATTTFTAGSIGTTSVSATVDGQMVSTTINIGTLPLAVSSIDPGNDTVNVAPNKVILVTFNQDIKSGNNQIELKNTKTGIMEPFSTSINGATLSITPVNLLASGTLYQVLLHSGAVTDLSGKPVSAYLSQFTTMPPLTVSSTDPAHKATNVALNKVIQVTFNQNIQSGSNWIELLNTKTGKGEIITTSISGKVLTLTPTKLLSNAVPYLVVIHTGAVKDLSGNLVSAYLSQFTTMPALAVSSSDPANKAVNVPLNKVIQITFNQDLQAGTDWIELLNTKTGKMEPVSTSINGKTLTITPANPMNTATTYYILIHTGAVNDVYGKPVSAYVGRFTTVPVLAVSSSDPANKAVNVPVNKVIQITFNQDLQAGTDWIELLNTKTNQFETITTSISGKVLTLTPTSTLNTATTYYILIHTGAVKDLYGNPVSATVLRFTTI